MWNQIFLPSCIPVDGDTLLKWRGWLWTPLVLGDKKAQEHCDTKQKNIRNCVTVTLGNHNAYVLVQ